MNREIKFRGKRIDNGHWVFGDYFKTPLSDENSGTPPDAGWFFLTGETRHCIGQDGVAFVVDPKTVGQFTGLFDKNSKEIFEGDIVKLRELYETPEMCNPTYKIWRIIFAFGSWHLANTSSAPDYDELTMYQEIVNYDGDIEVIGNIYDNPDLLTAVQ